MSCFRWTTRNIIIILMMMYVGFSCWMIFSLLGFFNGSTDKGSSILSEVMLDKNTGHEENEFMKLINRKEVHIWDKAGGTGLYLWEDILNADIESENGGLSKYGTVIINDITFRFHGGKATNSQEIDLKTQHLILILNTRVPSKIPTASYWMDRIETLPQLRSVIVLLLGDEQCRNQWMDEYTEYYRGELKSIFVVYDDRRIGNGLWHQWPLGVAKYRKFEVQPQLINLQGVRQHMCNFLGTVYQQSSREYLMNLIKSSNLDCMMKVRFEWQPHETEESLYEYMRALGNSDLTLSPVGLNSECYRMFEACAYGSVPVVEDVMTPGDCGDPTTHPNATTAPFKLIKRFNPPFIFVKSWDELPAILDRERNMPLAEKVKRRLELLQWYDKFKSEMKSVFLDVVNNGFFSIS